MTKPFFIMIYSQSGEGGFPMTDEEGEVKFYASEKEARAVADSQFAASALGYEVFEM